MRVAIFSRTGAAAIAMLETRDGPGRLYTRRCFRVEKAAPLALVTEMTMLDAMYLAIGFGFLAVAVLYVVACDRL